MNILNKTKKALGNIRSQTLVVAGGGRSNQGLHVNVWLLNLKNVKVVFRLCVYLRNNAGMIAYAVLVNGTALQAGTSMPNKLL